MSLSPSYGPPASHFSERSTTGAQTDHNTNPPSQAVSIPTNETASNDFGLLVQQIAQAIDEHNWHFVKEEIMKRGPNSYVAVAGTALRFIIHATRDNTNRGASIFDTVKELVEMAPSDDDRNAIVNQEQHDGRTLLHVLVSFTFSDPFGTALVDYLLCHGAIATIRDNAGQTPLHLAAANLCEGNIRVLLEHLKETTDTLFDNSFATPLDCAITACQKQMPNTPEVVDRTKVYNSVSEECQRCIKLLEDYHKEMKEASRPENANRDTYGTSSACMSSVHVLRSHPPTTGPTAGQFTTTCNWITLHRTVNEVLEGPGSVMKEVRRQKEYFHPGSVGFLTTWIHLPVHNLEWVEKAAEIAFGSDSDVHNSTRSFIKYMKEDDKLSRPGSYVSWDAQKLSTHLLVQCSVVPTLDVNRRAPLHCRNNSSVSLISHDRRMDCLEILAQREKREEQKIQHVYRLWKTYESSVVPLEQTLDEYCYQSLKSDPKMLNLRDRDQVLSRFLSPKSTSDQDKKTARKLPKDDVDAKRHICADPQEADKRPIVVVSNLLVWKIGDLVITTYGEEFNPVSINMRRLRQRVWTRCQIMQASMPTASEAAGKIVQCILEETVKNEPVVPIIPSPQTNVRLLDGAGPFASEIASESHEVTKSFENYPSTLGKVDATYKKSVEKETLILLRLDDILNELAMIRRVQEDARLVCLDSMFDDTNNANYSLVDSWAERSRSKVKSLENEALRVRKSLVTLLSLKQREVNAESLINSELQSQILFVFTAATVLFTPLSWISSLMALDIEGFTPQDSKWSVHAAAVPSGVTLAGFLILMAFCLLVWRAKSVYKFAKNMMGFNREEPDPDTLIALQNLKYRPNLEGGIYSQKMDV